jgi:hypothetical protein
MVRRTADNPAAWEVGTGYSKEPHADSKKTMVLTDGGHMLSDERVVSREVLPTGDLVFVTEVEGEDDNRPALFRFESAITAHEYTRRKMVRLEDGSGDGKFFQRHVYRWRR